MCARSRGRYCGIACLRTSRRTPKGWTPTKSSISCWKPSRNRAKKITHIALSGVTHAQVFGDVFLSSPFEFLDPGEMREEDFYLSLHETVQPLGSRSPAYRFYIRRNGEVLKWGRIELR